MNAPDLSRLKIDRSSARTPRSRKPAAKLLWIALVVVLVGGFGAWRYFKAPIAVETVTVTTAYPYQGVTLMNATGYVVAQRKAVDFMIGCSLETFGDGNAPLAINLSLVDLANDVKDTMCTSVTDFCTAKCPAQ